VFAEGGIWVVRGNASPKKCGGRRSKEYSLSSAKVELTRRKPFKRIGDMEDPRYTAYSLSGREGADVCLFWKARKNWDFDGGNVFLEKRYFSSWR